MQRNPSSIHGTGTWAYVDITALGRQEEWEDSPDGYPQTWTSEEVLRRWWHTTVRFTHSRLWDEEALRTHEDGWSKLFVRLERVLDPVPPGAVEPGR